MADSRTVIRNARGLVAVAKAEMGDPDMWRPGYGTTYDPGPVDVRAMWAFGQAAVETWMEHTQAFQDATGYRFVWKPRNTPAIERIAQGE